MNYYVASAKCGHVGRNNYIIKNFYVRAEDGEEAAKIVRYTSRVKHTRKDAIITMKKITEEEYAKGTKLMKKDMYFHVHNKQDQIKYQAVNDVEILKEIKEKPKYKKSYIKQHIKYAILDKYWKKQQARR